MNSQPSVGIVAIGSYIPRRFQTAADLAVLTGIPEQVIVEKLGIRRKPVPGPEDHTNAMGIKAAQDAIARAKISPDEIDVVLGTTEEYKEYPVWTASIKLAYDIGARKSWAVDVHQRCANFQTTLKIAKSLMVSDPAINTVLIAGGYRNGELVDLTNPRTTFLYCLSCGASAVILRKHHPRNHVLESAIIVDGSFSLDVVIPAGGTVEPVMPATAGGPRTKFDVPDIEGMRRKLDACSAPNFFKVIDLALERSGYSRADLGYLALLHIKPSFHRLILDELGLRDDQTYYLQDYGHIGEQDQLLSLKLGMVSGRLKDGQIAVLVGAGVGYAWSATAVKWGPCP